MVSAKSVNKWLINYYLNIVNFQGTEFLLKHFLPTFTSMFEKIILELCSVKVMKDYLLFNFFFWWIGN